ncbi:MAG: DUF1848 family protein, partial [Coriobacteriales bacterium]|nr:DUF1848 family protein [Coriobacteriales bacterium]
TAQWYAPWLLRRFEEGYVGQRAGCGCFESRDVGAYDSCPNGCRYCYANRDHVKALDNYLHAHDPESPLLIGHLRDGDEVSQASQRSLLAQGSQLSLGI